MVLAALFICTSNKNLKTHASSVLFLCDPLTCCIGCDKDKILTSVGRGEGVVGLCVLLF